MALTRLIQTATNNLHQKSFPSTREIATNSSGDWLTKTPAGVPIAECRQPKLVGSAPCYQFSICWLTKIIYDFQHQFSVFWLTILLF
jgi:hypothetical protein